MDKPHLVLEEASRVLSFWFDELSSEQWFTQDSALDRTISSHFYSLHRSAALGELWPWRATPTGRLAEIIVLDQFSRNMFRHTAQAFAYDGIALVLAQEAVSVEADKTLTPQQSAFLYMPFMHSESLVVQDIAQQLFSAPGLETQLEFQQRHAAVLQQFGRYPHRNQVLGRQSTAEELAFLEQNPQGF